ncbi:MAG: MopE-related protein [Myxococcota bacterium]|nr:MopE-related protein [Myxococcota bacterium]
MPLTLTPLRAALLPLFAVACATDSGLKIHEEPPTAAVLDPGENDSFVEGLPVAFRVRLDDNDDGFAALDVAWRSDTVGTLRGDVTMDGNVQTFVTTDLALGIHVVTVTATDPDGQVATDDVRISVVENSVPAVSIVSPLDDTAYGEDHAIVVVAEVDDAEEDPEALTLRWMVGANPILDAPDRPEADGLSLHTLTGLAMGTHPITVTVSDGLGQTSTARIDVRVVPEDGDGDGAATGELGGEDCDDTNPDVGPGAAEVCDGVDNDCDGLVDADDPDIVDPIEGHPDLDGDGYGDDSISILTCDLADLSDVPGDCNDADPTMNPGAVEVCGDGLDNDCDGTAGSCAWSGDVPVSEANFASYGESAWDRLATTMAGADMNGDGHADLIVAAQHASDTDSSYGAVYVIEGPLAPTVGGIESQAAVVIDGSHRGGYAGGGLTTLDFDWDGTDDLVIGAPRVDSPHTDAEETGEVYLFYGSIGADTETAAADLTIVGARAQQRLGQHLDGGGDLDGDGLPDLVIGSPQNNSHAYKGGGIYVFTGEGSMSGVVSVDDCDSAVASSVSRTALGAAIAYIGDTNGDGRDDLLVGAPKADENGLDSGAALLFLGHATNFSTGLTMVDTSASATYYGESAGDRAGTAVTGLGDIDGDGYTEFAVGAPYTNDLGPDSGAVYVMVNPDRTGSHALAETADTAFYGSSEEHNAGTSLTGDLDLNNDGFADMVIGSPGSGTSAYQAGASYVIYGPLADHDGGALVDPDGGADAAFLGMAAFNYAGKTVLGGHDWSGDGVTDLAVASPQYYRSAAVTSSGAVHVFFGRGL